MTEKDLELAGAMRAGRRGDAVAYARVLTDVARLVRPRVRRRLGRAAQEAEDIVQEVLLAIHAKNATWDETQPLLPWVYAIADHKVVDASRRRARSARIVSDTVSAEDVADFVPQPEPERDTIGLDIERHLAGLSRREREVVQALSIEGGTVAGVAARLGMREGAVRVALHRGLKRLAEAARRQDDPTVPERRG